MCEAAPEVPEVDLGRAPQELLDYFEHLYAKHQQLTAELMRVADRIHGAAKPSEQEFIGDELALMMNVHPSTGRLYTVKSVLACAIPGLVAAMEAGELTERHVHAASDELHGSLADPDVRETVLATVLDRCRERAAAGRRWPFPGELARMLREEALRFDQQAAERRKEKTRRDRNVTVNSLPDGAASLGVTGPAEKVAVMYEAIRARAGQVAAGDERTLDERMFDAGYDLLTTYAAGGTLPDGTVVPGVALQVISPISTALGGDLELGELVGYGPLLPSTTRELLAQAETVQRVCVDAVTGQVISIDDAEPYDLEPLDWMLTQPAGVGTITAQGYAPRGRRDGPGAYRPTTRMIRFIKTRDRTCRFPGCRRVAEGCDVDHRNAWPLGLTEPSNLHCLCRHHHRAKQTELFTVAVEPDGTTVWTTRTGRVYRRPPPDW